ncbi:MAG: hypothetical protein E7376_01960 [Clostridiales bacterium]|nr:hypothetical protein [Clostridiales bacterium]
MQISNLFGKQVFALYEGEIIGTIIDANFNASFNKVLSLKLFDMEENEFELKINNIKAIGECIILSNKTKLNIFLDRQKKSPMFKPVIDENANLFGKIIDCEIDEKGNVLYYLTDTQTQLSADNIYIRKNFVYYCTNKFVADNLKPRVKVNSLDNIKVNILQFENSKSYDNIVPSKLQYNTDTILGKVAKSNLFGVNNEIIIKANQVINEKTIEDATRHNRLNQLYFIAN